MLIIHVLKLVSSLFSFILPLLFSTSPPLSPAFLPFLYSQDKWVSLFFSMVTFFPRHYELSSSAFVLIPALEKLRPRDFQLGCIGRVCFIKAKYKTNRESQRFVFQPKAFGLTREHGQRGFLGTKEVCHWCSKKLPWKKYFHYFGLAYNLTLEPIGMTRHDHLSLS